MGGGVYSNTSYDSHIHSRTDAGYTARATRHSDDIARGRASRQVHQRLNPLGLTVRESRDSDEHPESLPIAVFLDVTGSMSTLPMVAMEKLPTLMGLLLTRNYVPHPQVLFGAIGDATCDEGPLQVGQFESAIQMAEDIDHMWAEGGGGGQQTESYELAYYIAARHTALDSVEKRNVKGYLFTIGDELPYPNVHKSQVRTLVGAGLERSIPTADIIREAQEKFHCFHLVAAQGYHGRDEAIRRHWRRLLGDDHVIVLDDMTYCSEVIAVVVGLMQGSIDLDRGIADLTDYGVTGNITSAIREAVRNVAERAIVLRS